MKFSTRAIHAGEEPNFKEGGCGDVVIPIHLASTFARKEIDKPTNGYEYSRTQNPTRLALETRLAALESSKYGLAFSSGLAAEATLLLSLLQKGDHVVAFDDLYSGTKRLLNQSLSNFGISVTYVDATDPKNVENALLNNTKLIWLETPTNPLMKLCDIQKISHIAKESNALLVVDNTFMSPYFQNPLELGADIALHSTTKYIGGHSDVVGGAIMLSNKRLYSKILFNQNAIGAIPSPFDCFLVMRGIKTLAVRMERHNYNALKIAKYLEKHSRIEKVNYPGLKSHPYHELANRQQSGFGGMLSFEIKGDMNDVKAFLQRTKIFALAESLGGVESLIEHPWLMTHSSLPQKARENCGITKNLVRVSVGIEDVTDLICDLDQALEE